MQHKHKILFIDDEEINRFLFSTSFANSYEIITASDGLEGMKLLQENDSIEVIVTDFNMPKMNGLTFIEKAKESYPDKKYFILTGFDLTQEIKAALESGLIIEKFGKPFNFDAIDLMIKKALAS